MSIDVTTIGPVTSDTRDRVQEFKIERGLQNYEEAIKALLTEAGWDVDKTR